MGEALCGKVAVVTGGGDGMGRATVERFVQEGARVVIADIQDDKGRQLAADLGDVTRFVHCDIRNEAQMIAAVGMAVESFGGLDIMHHLAASGGSQLPIDEISVEDWDDAQAVHTRGSMLAVKTAVPPMRQRGGGSIILTSSAIALNMMRGSSPAYVVGKGGVIYLGRIASLRYASDRIRVNTIVPGGIPTALHITRFGYSQEMADAMAPYLIELMFNRFQPLPYYGTGADIAAAAVFLASAESKWITGVDLRVDGGFALDSSFTAADMEAAVRQAEQLVLAEAGRA